MKIRSSGQVAKKKSCPSILESARLVASLMVLFRASIIRKYYYGAAFVFALLLPLSLPAGTVEKALDAFTGKISPVEPGGGPVTIIAAVPTFLFVEKDGTVLQLVKLEVVSHTREQAEAEVRTETNGGSFEESIVVEPGKSELVVKVPHASGPGRFVVSMDNGELSSASFDWEPARKWTVYVTHLSHFDHGYTDTHKGVMEKNRLILDRALAYARQTEDWPEDSKFRWTADAAYPVLDWLSYNPERRAELAELAREGRFEVNAKLAHLCSSVAGWEMLARELYPARLELAPLLETEPVTAIHTDVPGLTWGDVTVLTGAGVENLLLLPNRMYRGAAKITVTRTPQAFYWAGPDGSRLLAWRSRNGYSEARFLIEGPEATARQLPRALMELQRSGYELDLVHFTRSGLDRLTKYEDNAVPRLEVAESIRAWNRAFAYPRLVLSTPSMFFRELASRYGDDLPMLSGDMPDWWADGSLTDAREEGVSRRTHAVLRQAELWSAVAAMNDADYDYPAQALNAAHLGNYLFDEHTWGYFYPFLPKEELIFRAKKKGLIDAYNAALKIRDGAMAQVAGDGDKIAVFNALGWEVTGPAVVPLENPGPPVEGSAAAALRDLATGDIRAAQRASDEEGLRYLFVAEGVPALGYRLYQPVAGESLTGTVTEKVDGSTVIETPLFRIELDGERCGLSGLYHKELGVELVDRGSEYALAALITRDQGLTDGFDIRRQARVRKTVVTRGPVFTGIEMNCSLPGSFGAKVKSCFRAYGSAPYVDVTIEIENYLNAPGQSRYAAFPFGLQGAEALVETPWAMMRPGRDQLPDFASFYAASHWVRLEGEKAAVTWSGLESPIIELGRMKKPAAFMLPYFPETFPDAEPREEAHIYSELMNNFQNTNYHYMQSGSARWTYRVFVHRPGLAWHLAGRSGWELSHPLTAIRAAPRGMPAGPEASFIEVEPGSVTPVTIKRAEDGRGMVVRLFESSGKRTDARVRLPGHAMKRAVLCDVTERELRELEVDRGAAFFSAGPHSLTTLYIEPGERL